MNHKFLYDNLVFLLNAIVHMPGRDLQITGMSGYKDLHLRLHGPTLKYNDIEVRVK